MSRRKPPLSTVEEQELELLLNDPTTVEVIKSEATLSHKITLIQKYFEKTEDRKYASIEEVLLERLKFVQFATKDRHDRHSFAWQYMSDIEAAYTTILDRKEDNHNKILEAINTLHKFIKNGAIKTLLRLSNFNNTPTTDKIKDTLTTYDIRLQGHIRESLKQITTSTKNKEDGYQITKFTKHIYKIINKILITPVTTTGKGLGETKPLNTDNH